MVVCLAQRGRGSGPRLHGDDGRLGAYGSPRAAGRIDDPEVEPGACQAGNASSTWRCRKKAPEENGASRSTPQLLFPIQMPVDAASATTSASASRRQARQARNVSIGASPRGPDARGGRAKALLRAGRFEGGLHVGSRNLTRAKSTARWPSEPAPRGLAAGLTVGTSSAGKS